MATATAVALVWVRGSVAHLVTMYSINVFVTFSLSELAMVRLCRRDRRRGELLLHLLGLGLCTTILAVTLHEKFLDGGWVTVVVTGAFVTASVLIRRHYDRVGERLATRDAALERPTRPDLEELPILFPDAPTAVLLVRGYRAIGVSSFETIQRLYPGFHRNFVFVSVAVVDVASGLDAGALEQRLARELEGYVDLAQRHGATATIATAVGTDVVDEVVGVASEVVRQFPRAHFFVGRILLDEDSAWAWLLHNDTGTAIARKLQAAGVPTVTLPTRV